jgi:thioredoxin reductase (NADPH)
VTGLYAGTGAGLSLETADGPASARAVVLATGRTPGRLAVPDADSWVGRGLSECASCDGPLYAGRRVAVVGADEWAAREARELAGLTESVTLLVPGLPRWSSATAARLAEDSRIEVRTDTVVVTLLGEDALSELLLGDGTELPVSGVFVYTGKTPRTELLAGLAADTPGLFLAGDVRREASPYLLNAAADGLRAGLAAAEFVGR